MNHTQSDAITDWEQEAADTVITSEPLRSRVWSPACIISVVMLLFVVVMPTTSWAQEPDAAKPAAAKAKEPLPMELGKNWVRATKDYEVWVDFKKKQVLVGGEVCLREGLLEMFACPRGTKEHESVVAVNTPARYVHAALVAVGAKPGPPVQFQPHYRPAQGTPIKVTIVWKDQQGKKHSVPAQQWVKRISTGKPLAYDWVFAGSGFWVDEAAGERFYYADGGEFICVSNFATAMLDLPVESSDANDSLMFCAFSQHIPPRGTRVCLILTPKLDAKPKAAAKPKTQEVTPGAKAEGTEKDAAKKKTKPAESEGKGQEKSKHSDATPAAADPASAGPQLACHLPLATNAGGGVD